VVKVYTRTGDGGETSLFSGGRVGKDDPRVEAYGTVDELSALLGLLGSEPLPAGVEERLAAVQEALFSVGGALADPERKLPYDPAVWAPAPLEAWIDEMDAELPPLRAFILPGGTRGAALAHQARTVCRRAERRVRSLEGIAGDVPRGVLSYLNRLSDCLFVLARFVNARQGEDEREWRPRSRDGEG
jgi:cob(I)alamin adenosyltransferase